MRLGITPTSGEQEAEMIWDKTIMTYQILPAVTHFLQLGLTSQRSHNLPEPGNWEPRGDSSLWGECEFLADSQISSATVKNELVLKWLFPSRVSIRNVVILGNLNFTYRYRPVNSPRELVS